MRWLWWVVQRKAETLMAWKRIKTLNKKCALPGRDLHQALHPAEHRGSLRPQFHPEWSRPPAWEGKQLLVCWFKQGWEASRALRNPSLTTCIWCVLDVPRDDSCTRWCSCLLRRTVRMWMDPLAPYRIPQCARSGKNNKRCLYHITVVL